MNGSETKRIYTFPAPVLRKTAEPVTNIDEETQSLIESMAEAMYAAPGIGLAANQVGVLKRIVVYDLGSRDNSRDLKAIINPEIVLAEGDVTFEESCLSVIDYAAEVSRSANVKIRGVDRNGDPVDVEADGLLAVCLQHEIDHLNGILYIDHISSLKRTLYKKKLKKLMKREDSP